MGSTEPAPEPWTRAAARNFRGVVLSPLYAAVLTLLIIFAGGFASLYADDIKDAWPINYQARSGWSWRAFFAWMSALSAALMFFFRQRFDDEARAGAQDRLVRQAVTLEELVRTMPPANFLASLAALYEAADDVLVVALGEPEPPFNREVVDPGIRQVLGKIATLAKVFDGDHPGTRYAANVMLFYSREDMGEEMKREVRPRLRFCDEAVSIDNLQGVLILNPRLSAVTGDPKADPDPFLEAFALPVPMTPRDAGGKWRALPGAPHAFVTGEPDIFLDFDTLRVWCERHGDFTEQVIRELNDYLHQQKEHFQSFISIALKAADGEGPKRPFGVLTVHCSRPRLLKDEPTAIGQFVAVIQPMKIILEKLLLVHRRDVLDAVKPDITPA